MSDFHLTEIAPFVEKDARTLRRWCVLGHVPGAYRRPGKRGHWRIRGESRAAVVAAVRQNRPKNARRRRETSYPVPGFFDDVIPPQRTPRRAWRELDKDHALAILRSRGHTVERAFRGAELWFRRCVHLPGRGVFDFRSRADRARYLVEIISELRATEENRSQDKDLKELKRLDLEWTARNTFDGDYDGMIDDHLKGRRRAFNNPDDGYNAPDNPYPNPDKFPRISATMLAAKMRTSRSTFCRWFPYWKTVVDMTTQGAGLFVRVGRDERGGLRGDSIFEQVDMPEHCTENERRMFTSAALYG